MWEVRCPGCGVTLEATDDQLDGGGMMSCDLCGQTFDPENPGSASAEVMFQAFRDAVRRAKWRPAVMIGQKLLREFPGSESADEVRKMMTMVRMRADKEAMDRQIGGGDDDRSAPPGMLNLPGTEAEDTNRIPLLESTGSTNTPPRARPNPRKPTEDGDHPPPLDPKNVQSERKGCLGMLLLCAIVAPGIMFLVYHAGG